MEQLSSLFGYFLRKVGTINAFALLLLAMFTQIAPDAQAKLEEGDLTRFSPDEGQPLFPKTALLPDGNLNVFKQYVVGFDLSERVGATAGIDLGFLGSIKFGGELAAEVNANFGLEVGLCFGGNADFDLAFKPVITLPDRYPSELPIPLTVTQGLRPDSYFTTTFPPLGKAYADLIFDVGANMHATACVFGCVEGINFGFSTCDVPPINGFRLFNESVRCDPALNEKAYCSVELASFNRGDDNVFRMLNVTAANRFEFIEKPYLEVAPSLGAGQKKAFSVDPNTEEVFVEGIHRFSNGKKVKVSASGGGRLPAGLSGSTVYKVKDFAANGPGAIRFKLANELGTTINIRDLGVDTMQIFLYETNKPDSPTFGKYGTISLSAPTIGTDSRTSAIDGESKSFNVNTGTDEIIVTSLRGLRNGNKVRISSIGGLPTGLSEGCVYYVTNARSGGSIFQLATRLSGTPVGIIDSGTGTHRVSLVAEFSTAQVLKSTGAEDVMGIEIDVAALVGDLLLPPSFPSLSDSGSIGPLDWRYTLASLDMGPAVQLKTDFEMTWDLVVDEITFKDPVTQGSGIQEPRDVIIFGKTVSSLSAIQPARIVHLTNTGPNALPTVQLLNILPVEVTITYKLAPKLKTVVSTPFIGRVKYSALEAGASISRVGELSFGPLIKGEHNFKFGEFKVFDGNPSPIESGGPDSDYNLDRYSILLIDTASDTLPVAGCAEIIIYLSSGSLNIRIFDTTGVQVIDGLASSLLENDSFTALNAQLNPWPISPLSDGEQLAVLEAATASSDYQPGRIQFIMKAAGPPSFEWAPSQITNTSTHFWTQSRTGPLRTNWVEVISIPPSTTGYPGIGGGTSSDALIDESPFPSLFKTIEIATLTVAPTRELNIFQGNNGPNSAQLTIGGGFVENGGKIAISSASGATKTPFLMLNSPDALLCGPGTVELSDGAELRGYDGFEPFSFTNYNTISGVGSAMDVYFSTTQSSINNLGTYSAEGSEGLLITSAQEVLNQGHMGSTTNTDFSVYGDRFDSRVNSDLTAVGTNASTYVSFDEVEHAGLLWARQGGYVNVGSFFGDRAFWNAGRSFNGDVGIFRATSTDSLLEIDSADITGGFFDIAIRGSLMATDTVFTGSVLNIGEFNSFAIDPGSGFFTLKGDENLFYNTRLTNYGTFKVDGQAEFIDTEVFANNGTVEVTAGSMIHVFENTIDTVAEGASEEAKRQPGMANATSESLVGGTWNIEGTMLIDGAAITSIGGNIARASTASGSIDELDNIKQSDEDDKSRVLSLGAPAHVRLRGENWSFPALDTLAENRGTFELSQGAQFPSQAETTTVGDFVNRGELLIDSGSLLKVGGSFIQAGAFANTEIFFSGGIVSSTKNYQIIGGEIIIEADTDFLSRVGNTFATGTTIRVESPMIDTNETNPLTGEIEYIQIPVALDFENSIQFTSIDAGVDVTLHGSAIRFQALTDHLVSNAGTFTLSGDGIDNSGSMSFAAFSGEEFTNTGELNVLGYTSEFFTAGYVQNGFNAVTHIGAGASLLVSGSLNINNGGQIILDIAARPDEGFAGQVNSSAANFGNGLIVNFIDEIAIGSPDIGDTWVIMPKTSSATILGAETENVTFLHEGAPLPSDWLPAGTHLEMVQFDTGFGAPRGLGIRVVPAQGFKNYYAWAEESGFAQSSVGFLADPYQDADGDGILNGQEYLFGADNGKGTTHGQFGEQEFVVGSDGKEYLQMSYMRPSGNQYRETAYVPYISGNMVDWFAAPMLIESVEADSGSNLERVTLRSIFPFAGRRLFTRFQASFNPADFADGAIPTKPIVGIGSFENLGYKVGQVLFCNVNADADFGSVYGTGVYRDRSNLGSAVVHAGLLGDGDHGVVKVTFIPRQESFVGTTQNSGTSDQVTSESFTYSSPDAEPNAISYTIELLTHDS